MWDLPRPGLEPVSPALAGGFLTTAAPGKSHLLILYSSLIWYIESFLKGGGKEKNEEEKEMEERERDISSRTCT